MKNINLKGAAEYVKSMGYEVSYIAVYGSQNYGLDINTEEYESDVDYKCVVIPTLKELVWQTKPVSMVVEFEGGQIDVKDVRVFFDSVVKCNVNFLETLTTKHYLFFGEEHKFWNSIRMEIPKLIDEMGQSYLRCAYGMMTEKFHALDKEYPSTAHKVKKYGYDPKQLHHIVRLFGLMERYVAGCERGDFMEYGENSELLKSIKSNGVENKEQAFSYATNCIELAEEIRNNYKVEERYSVKNKIIELSREVIINNAIRKNEKVLLP